MIGSAGEITDKLLDAVKTLNLDRIFAHVDWGGLPSGPGRGIHRPLRHRHRARPPRRLTHKAGREHDFDTKGKRHA
jgi:hypothetical protein